MTCDHEVVGSNPAGRWAFFLIRSLKKEVHLYERCESWPKNIYTWQSCLRRSRLNKLRLGKKIEKFRSTDHLQGTSFGLLAIIYPKSIKIYQLYFPSVRIWPFLGNERMMSFKCNHEASDAHRGLFTSWNGHNIT